MSGKYDVRIKFLTITEPQMMASTIKSIDLKISKYWIWVDYLGSILIYLLRIDKVWILSKSLDTITLPSRIWLVENDNRTEFPQTTIIAAKFKSEIMPLKLSWDKVEKHAIISPIEYTMSPIFNWWFSDDIATEITYNNLVNYKNRSDEQILCQQVLDTDFKKFQPEVLTSKAVSKPNDSVERPQKDLRCYPHIKIRLNLARSRLVGINCAPFPLFALKLTVSAPLVVLLSWNRCFLMQDDANWKYYKGWVSEGHLFHLFLSPRGQQYPNVHLSLQHVVLWHRR